MKSTVEQLSPTRVKINVEVPFDELKPNFDRAYKKIAQQVRVPGFRPGKAPARVLEQRLGRGAVLDEVINEAVPEKYSELVSSGEVRPIGRPDIEVTKIEDGDHLAFTAEVDVRPEFELPSFDFAVGVEDVEVTDDEVNEQLNGLRTRFGTLTGVDRPVENGDFVTLDLSATVDGEEVEEAATTGLSYEVGSNEIIEGIDEALVGASAGETVTFTTTLVAGEFADREAEVSATVGSVKLRELPELDDEFAQLASEYDTLDELKANLRERLGGVKAMRQGSEARDKVLEALAEAVDIPLPETLLESEFNARKHDAQHVLDHDEQKMQDWLQKQGQTEEEFDEELRKSARDVVKMRLVLDAISDAHDVTVDEAELSERIIMQAQRLGMSPQDYIARVQETGELGALYSELRRSKALALVVTESTVTDASGNVVDLKALFGEPDQDEAAKAAAQVAAQLSADESAESSAEGSAEAAAGGGTGGEAPGGAEGAEVPAPVDAAETTSADDEKSAKVAD